jgi:GntR family transcriptional regulator, transcriptional repressor for pyruvate dehydrogenase complex
VTEARTLFEPGVVLPLVCERATETDVRELRALCDEEERARDEGTYSVAVSFAFHLRLAVHRAVVDAIERGDAKSASQLMSAHLKRTADAVAPVAPCTPPTPHDRENNF